MLLAAVAVLAPSLAAAQAPSTDAAKKPKHVKAKPPAAKAAEALPCPRAQWKDDPVCFGADDPAALPLPSARSTPAKEGSVRSGDVTISPKMKVNEESPEPVHINNPKSQSEQLAIWWRPWAEFSLLTEMRVFARARIQTGVKCSKMRA